MKKIFNLMIAFICVLLCSAMFAGCGVTKCEHTASDDWTMNSTHHWHECADCAEKMDKEEHDWEEIILIEATQTEDGVKHFNCKGCDMDRVEEYSITTVTEEIWNTAFDFAINDNYKVYAKAELTDGTIVVDGTITKDGDIVYHESMPIGNGYYSKESSKYYYYQDVSGTWTKTEITQENYEDAAGQNIGGDYNYSTFTYNEELKAYEGDSSDGLLQIYFASGRIVKIVVTSEGEGVQTMIVEYVEIELELPTID